MPITTRMKVPVVAVEGNIGAGKTALLNKFEQFLSDDEKAKIKIEHEPLVEFESFHRNDFVNPLEHFYQNPKENAFIFQKLCTRCILKKIRKVNEYTTSYKVILMNRGSDSVTSSLPLTRKDILILAFCT